MGTCQGKGSLLEAGALSLAASSALKARPSSCQSHFVTASVPPMLINGHRTPGRQQPPHSAESVVIYRIGALRKQLSELRETSDKWVVVGWGLERGNCSQMGTSETDPSDLGPGGEPKAHQGQVTCLGPLSRGIPQCQGLSLAACSHKLPGAHTLCPSCLPAERLLLTGSGN